MRSFLLAEVKASVASMSVSNLSVEEAEMMRVGIVRCGPFGDWLPVMVPSRRPKWVVKSTDMWRSAGRKGRSCWRMVESMLRKARLW